MKVYGYVKRDEGGDCSSGNLGEDAIRAYCKDKSMELVAIVRDNIRDHDNGISSAFKKLIKDITMENISTVVLDRLETFSENKEIQKWMTSYVLSKEINIYLVDTKTEFSGNPNLVKSLRSATRIQGELHKLDIDISHLKMLKRRNEIRQLKGKCEGRKSYREVAAPTIREIKRLRRGRQGKKRRTYADIAEILNQSGFRTLSLQEFTGNNVSVILHRLKKSKQGVRCD